MNNIIKYLPQILCSAAFFYATPAFSQVENEQEDDDTIIVIATGAQQNIKDSGTAISIITDAEILSQQAISVSSLLQELPGVNVTQSGGIGSQTSVRIRGAESDQTLVLINGIRVNDPSSPDGSFDFGNLLASNIERIEVLRGANGVAWGSQAVGGVVHITTKRPTDSFELFTQGEYGAQDTLRLTSNASGKVGPLGISVGGGYIKTDGISAFDQGTESDGYRQYSANASLMVDLADNIRFEANGYYADNRVESDSVFPPFSSESIEYSLAEEFYGNVAVSADAFDGRFKNRFAFSLADINRDIISPFFTSLPRGRTERFEYRGDFEIARMIRLVFGTEMENSRYENAGVNDRTGIDSLYFQAIIGPVERMTLTGGVRHDEHDDFGGRTSIAGNLAYQFSADGPVLRASYAEGFRGPSLIDLDGRPFGFGTPDLLPETAKSYEAGLEQTWLAGAVTTSVIVFRRDIRNQIAFAACPVLPDPAPAICANNQRPFGTTLNIERTRTTGVEAALTIKPTEKLTIHANYTFLDAENRSNGSNLGNELARRPSSSLYLNIDYQTAFGLKLGSDLQIVGDSFDDLANSRRIDGYALVGIRTSLPIAESFEIFGRVENLFDEDYQTATDFGTFGRSAYAGVRARF
ncbi:TonB-dependent receptor plug domain-containing protein [Parasphingorhabdus halotolerans]|uniref:TonB-dependent receptor n=1 Tax=Parasphingorhabdus halotolerans TaxID=2725558 RepID=A0A6H2DIV8_9SPHN|nr:TonB-dependent receptor [Parasphingorhabdus halotolerans]QJB68264.1 TonB-dependent receptor [Parasphingorhabdus halotolerans]